MKNKNPITGDVIATRPASKEYRDNYDLIFGKKETPKEDREESQEVDKDQD